MSPQILQVNMKFSIPRSDLAAGWLDAAQSIADVPGLRWKVWLMNEAEHEAGGIYLFESKAAAEAYVAGPTVAAAKASPFVSDISAKFFDGHGRPQRGDEGPTDVTSCGAYPRPM